MTFAKNIMEVAVPPSNPAHVTSVKNLSKSSVKTALCQPQVPCGFVAKKVFSLNKINVKPVTLQPDVKSVLTQVELNNVDAGMVYVTDVKAAGKKVKGIKIPADDNASTAYPIATIKKSNNMTTAQAFASYVLSPAGQKVLATTGSRSHSRRSGEGGAAATTRLSARDRVRRAERGGGSRRAPVSLLAPGLVAVAFLVLPLIGLVIRAPWARMGAVLSRSDALQALQLSLWTAVDRDRDLAADRGSAGLAAGPDRVPGQRLLRALVTLPLVLPPVVGGVALLLAFGRDGFIGGLLNSWFGLTIPFTPVAVVMAETFVAMPFLIVTVEGALRSADLGFEEAAATMGATKTTVFRRGHGADDRAVAGRRRGPVLGAGAGRVRRDDHVRGQFPRPDRDDADRRLLRAGERPGRGDRAQPGPAGRVGRGAGVAAGPVAAGRLGADRAGSSSTRP